MLYERIKIPRAQSILIKGIWQREGYGVEDYNLDSKVFLICKNMILLAEDGASSAWQSIREEPPTNSRSLGIYFLIFNLLFEKHSDSSAKMSCSSTLSASKPQIFSIRPSSNSCIRTLLGCRVPLQHQRNGCAKMAEGANFGKELAYATSMSGQRDFRCRAAQDVGEVIDVEGRMIDDRIPVTVRLRCT